MSEMDRKRKILDITEKKDSVSVRDLIQLVGASPATIRRDINDLVNNNLLLRTHGYVHSLKSASDILPVDERFEISSPEKKLIAKTALNYIKPGMNIILDSGTTTLELAKLLIEESMTIITNSLDVCAVLSQSQNTVICTGGILDNRTRCLLGSDAINFISRFEVDIAFMGTTGVRLGAGLTTASPLQADYKRACISSAKKAYALFDSTKFKSSSLYTFSKFTDLERMIISTSSEPDPRVTSILNSFDQDGYPYDHLIYER